MSNLQERLSNIIIGWKNVVWKTPDIELLAHTRAKMCAECMHNKRNICTKCGCPLQAKCRSPKETCPVSKW